MPRIGLPIVLIALTAGLIGFNTWRYPVMRAYCVAASNDTQTDQPEEADASSKAPPLSIASVRIISDTTTTVRIGEVSSTNEASCPARFPEAPVPSPAPPTVAYEKPKLETCTTLVKFKDLKPATLKSEGLASSPADPLDEILAAIKQKAQTLDSEAQAALEIAPPRRLPAADKSATDQPTQLAEDQPIPFYPSTGKR